MEINLWERTGLNGPRGGDDSHLRKRKQHTLKLRGQEHAGLVLVPGAWMQSWCRGPRDKTEGLSETTILKTLLVSKGIRLYPEGR